MSDLIKRADVVKIIAQHNAEVAKAALNVLLPAMMGDPTARGGADAFTTALEHATQIKDEIEALKAVTQ